MKYKILALSVVGALLAGCGSDNGNSVPSTEAYSVMAYDPAVMGIKGSFSCDDGTTGTLAATNYKGVSEVTELTVLNSPDTCAFEFQATPGAKDVSNGKDMSKVSYKLPKGLAALGKTATASPISTLLEKKLDGAPYTESAGNEIMGDLGLDYLINTGVITDITDFLLRTEEVISKLPAKAASRVLATNAVLSDVLVVSSDDVSADKLAGATKAIANEVVEKYKNYPKTNAGDKTIFLDLTEDSALIEGAVEDPNNVGTLPPKKEAKPVPEPDEGTTGGTGGGVTGG
ncbi:serine/threonine protein kinase [Vibrio toranzoniae]|uniref:serine/threonine protein kinase n=1 Tax=Vibrio toranzoniae TaxID=1194427 RepID=UPI001378F667|nr:serine/threonine protein kinase [Vibrio toranzoniae]NAZ46775.1 serine/threonine protein kinase [Vibrio toranzoniae]NAZ54538.1 serine/threonine protein kinase [Vibrio toranzoniae]